MIDWIISNWPWIVLATIILSVTHACAYWAGQLNELMRHYNEARRNASWSSIQHSQAYFNQDFFEELWQTNDPRLHQ